MRITFGQLRKVIREASFRAPVGWDDPPDYEEDEGREAAYDEVAEFFERASRSPDKRTDIRTPQGYYQLEDDVYNGQWVLIDPSGREENFYVDNSNMMSQLEELLVNLIIVS